MNWNNQSQPTVLFRPDRAKLWQERRRQPDRLDEEALTRRAQGIRAGLCRHRDQSKQPDPAVRLVAVVALLGCKGDWPEPRVRLELEATPNAPLTEFEGRQFGSGVALIFVNTDEPGVGPDLHQHPYSETFLIRSGRALFTVGGEQMIGVAGQIIVVPAFTPHKFEVIGPEHVDMIDIHANDTFITEWLEGLRANPQGSSAS